MFQQTPIFADVARYYAYPVVKNQQFNYIEIAAANGSDFGQVTLMPDNYFVLTAFRCFTNYDNCGGILMNDNEDIVGPVLVVPPFVPNNFTVQIARGQNNAYSNQPLTQAEICSSGYRAGKQLPIPVVYGPRFNFTFTFTDLTGLYLESGETSLPLRIQMWMEGYSVPQINWGRFCNYFPAFANVMAP